MFEEEASRQSLFKGPCEVLLEFLAHGLHGNDLVYTLWTVRNKRSHPPGPLTNNSPLFSRVPNPLYNSIIYNV